MFQKLKLPLFITLFFIILIVLWKILNLPSEEELLKKANDYFLRYGLVIVFLAALVESVLLIGWYIPGGIVIFLGVLLASGDPLRAFFSVIVTIFGFVIGYGINYFLGKYGWYRVFLRLGFSAGLQSAEEQFKKYSIRAIYFSYWQPNLGGLLSTAIGIAQAPFRKFFLHSTIATIVWSSFWGITTYVVGEKILSSLGIVFFAIMGFWVCSILYKEMQKK